MEMTEMLELSDEQFKVDIIEMTQGAITKMFVEMSMII